MRTPPTSTATVFLRSGIIARLEYALGKPANNNQAESTGARADHQAGTETPIRGFDGHYPLELSALMPEPKLQITVSKTGSYKVEGPITLIDHEGEEIETREGKPFFLCRCGLSSKKPFCDGAHNRQPWEHELAKH